MECFCLRNFFKISFFKGECSPKSVHKNYFLKNLQTVPKCANLGTKVHTLKNEYFTHKKLNNYLSKLRHSSLNIYSKKKNLVQTERNIFKQLH